MTAPLVDPYAILGVATEASDDDLDHAFRRLVRQLHPDTRRPALPIESTASAVPGGSEDEADEGLQQLLNAYATLRDPVRRAAYDRARARSTAPVPQPAASSCAADALVPDLSPIRVGPAIRVGAVHWEPPRPVTGPTTESAGAAGSRLTTRSHDGQ
ncbi:J domain-containing protein [Kribbella sp. NPDC000426]|uniref:J domain-containing protein n=1 Tax=Kribbella sp. NPDC000426 TaxID=3154255 RepID=UPI00332DD732